MGATAEVDFFGSDKGLTGLVTKIDDKLDNLGRSAKKTFQLIGVGFVANKTLDFFRQSVEAGREALRVQTKLEAVYRATGNAAGYSAEQSLLLSNQLAQLTNYADEAITEAQAMLGTFTQVEGDIFKDALVAALDLSEVFNQDLKSSVIQLGKALNDPIKGVSALSEVGISFSETQREMIKELAEAGDVMGAQKVILDELTAEFGGAASAAAEGYGGKLNNLKEIFGQINEDVGRATIDFLLEAMETMIDMGGVIAAVFTDFPLFVEMAATKSQLALLGFWNDIEHYATTAVPAWIDWLSDNWASVFVDMGNYVGTVVTNMWENLVNFFGNVASYMMGGEVDFHWTALTDGFEATMADLPEIADRHLTEAERRLKRKSDDLSHQFFSLAADVTEAMREAYGLGGTGSGPPDLAGPDIKKGLVDSLLGSFNGLMGGISLGGGEDGPLSKGLDAIADMKEAVGDTLGDWVDWAKDNFDDDRGGSDGSGEIVGLTDLFKRIQGAAAKSPEAQAALETADATKISARNSKVIAHHAEETGKGIGKLINKFSQGIPAVFGR